jgi:hypothetical protein
MLYYLVAGGHILIIILCMFFAVRYIKRKDIGAYIAWILILVYVLHSFSNLIS